MTRALVGLRHGKRVINWLAVILVSLVVGLVAGGSATLVWFLLTKEFNVVTVLFAIAFSTGWIVGTAIRDFYRLPEVQLTILD